MTKLFLFLSTFLLLLPMALLAQWDFSQHAIPLADIQSGGPPKDGISALSEPDYLPAGTDLLIGGHSGIPSGARIGAGA